MSTADNTKSNTDSIISGLKWLEDRYDSTDIASLSHGLNRMAILTARLADEVVDAYELLSQLEDNFDEAFAKKFSELTGKGTSAAAAKPMVEAELVEMKREWTRAKVLYKKLNSFLDRCDRVMDTFRQSISVQKQADMKNI
jgi:hypothetical protein